MMTNPFKDLFISYGRRESLGLVGRLHQRLKLAGYEVWFDKVNIPDGDDYAQRINHGIESAHNFVYVMAPRSLTSPYCLMELEYARILGKRVIPINHQVIFDTDSKALSEGDKQVLVNFYKQHHLPNPHIQTTPEVLARSLAVVGRTDWLDAKETLSDDDCNQLSAWAQPYENHWKKHEDLNFLKSAEIPVFGQVVDELEGVIASMTEVIERQSGYVHQHTQILSAALWWQNNQKATPHLLVGKERDAAQEWLLTPFVPPKQPPCQATPLIGEFLSEARKNAENLMTDVFICYDVDHDKAIRDQVICALWRYGKTIWTHDRDIKTGHDYQGAIEQGIENADNFFYLISPHSVQSEYCQQELAHAQKYNKRIVPLFIEATPENTLPDALIGLQYIDFTNNINQSDFDSDMGDILNLLHHEQDYYQQHKILLARALKWQAENFKPSFLLRGHNLENAKTWLRLNDQREPHPPLALHEKLITASEAAKGQLSTEVFISYSRKNGDFARPLNTALQEAGKTTWFDQESISTGANFEKELFKGIEGADNFLFILSPESVESEYCEREVNYAALLGKRFLTVLHRETDPNTMPEVLRKIQWLDFSAEFEAPFLDLVRALDQQQDYVHQHTQILTQALHWQQHQKANPYLFSGEERLAAEEWLLTTFRPPEKPPCQPSNLMCELISESRKHADNLLTDIFVCYDKSDQAIRETVIQALRCYAKTCWLHERDIPTGVRVEYAIEQGIEGADNFLFFISKASVDSAACQRELAHALSYHKRIMPLLVEPTAAIPDALQGLQPIDLTDEKSIEVLLNRLASEQDYYHQHKTWLVRSRKWAAANRQPTLLLRAHNLERAKTWLQAADKRQQHLPLPLHRELIKASDEAVHQRGTELFISYSRRDNDFVQKLSTRLQEAGKTIWFDQETQQSYLSAAGDFEQETFKGIDEADNVVFIASPPSVASRYCQAEIEHAAAQGKRIMVLSYRPVESEALSPTLREAHWINFSTDFEKSFLELSRLLDQQKTYVHQHTEILIQAKQWAQHQQATQQLLVGQERTTAENWLLTEFLPPTKPPCQPTALMCEFLCEARKNAENLMTDIFICHEKQDQAIRDRVIQSLSRYVKTTWTHDRDIQKGERYERAIERGIEWADNFFFFISPASVASDYCQQELAHALNFHKRIVPLLIAPTPVSAFPDRLRSLQYIDLTEPADYETKILEILNLLKQAQDYYKQHKVLLVRALKWQSENYKPSFLLRGHNLENAKTWLRLSEQREQHLPLELHRQLTTASEAAKGQLGTEVFLSYSRKDSDFARHLNTRLQEAGKTTWFDQESISSGVDFEKEIYKGIDGADNFVFVVSPDAVESEYCEREVNYASEKNKRFISVLHREPETQKMPEALRVINWIDFKETAFEKSFPELIQAIELDRDHAHQHTVLQQRASDWAEHQNSGDFLLNQTACDNAEAWQTQALTESKSPVPTPLQQAFVQESRRAIQKANRRRNILFSLMGVLTLLAVVASGLAYMKMNEAEIAKADAQRLYQQAFKSSRMTKEEATKVAKEFIEAEEGRVFRDDLKKGHQGPEMVRIPGGEFQMGDGFALGNETELPRHPVAIKPFAIGRYEVTVGEFKQFVQATGYQTEAEAERSCLGYGEVTENKHWAYIVDIHWRHPNFVQTDDHPVVCVSWNDAVAYTQWLSDQTGQIYRLPSEAEWEYAARGGKETPYWWGAVISKGWGVCQNCGSEWDFKQTAPVNSNSFVPNPFGLYHVIGNVSEWVLDPWHENYEKAPKAGQVWHESEKPCQRVSRGGGWHSPSKDVRLASRRGASKFEGALNSRSGEQGLRVVREEKPLPQAVVATEKRLAELKLQCQEVVTFKGFHFDKVQAKQVAQQFIAEEGGRLFRHPLKDGGKGPEMVRLPGGTFRMGDIQGGGRDNEQPVHEVSVEAFAIGRYEVTFDEYDRFVEATTETDKPNDEGWGRGDRPVINVSWYDAMAYTEWLTEQTGQEYRLPTEAQWEYAARAGTETKYFWGNGIGSNWANCDNDYCGDRFDQTAPVGSFGANPFGLYDTVGNVWEWTCSEYEEKYQGKELSCLRKNSNNIRVLRGGSWNVNVSNYVRTANRLRNNPVDRFNDLGIRVVARTF